MGWERGSEVFFHIIKHLFGVEEFPQRRSGMAYLTPNTKHPRHTPQVSGDQSMTSAPKYSGLWKSGFSVPTGFHIP